VHPGRSGRNHLRVAARTNGLPLRRVDEVIDQVGLGPAAGRRVKGYSLGMRQRLGIATALLGDPEILMLDEPVNGLDPEGIRWIRELLRSLAAQGRTVLVSSHLMGEMALTADHLIVIGRGRLLADMPTEDFIEQASPARVRVRSPQATRLRELLLGEDVTVSSDTPGTLEVAGLSTDEIGERAAQAGLTLHELTAHRTSLEAAFMEMTRDSVEYEAVA
jgi:ABC-2 type transport system ATP-binding protein